MGEVTGLKEKRVHEHKGDAHGHYVYNECWLPEIEDIFKFHILLCRTDDAIATINESLNVEQLDPSLGSVNVSFLPADSDNECDWDIGNFTGSLYPSCERRDIVLNNFQALVKHSSFPAVITV